MTKHRDKTYRMGVMGNSLAVSRILELITPGDALTLHRLEHLRERVIRSMCRSMLAADTPIIGAVIYGKGFLRWPDTPWLTVKIVKRDDAEVRFSLNMDHAMAI